MSSNQYNPVDTINARITSVPSWPLVLGVTNIIVTISTYVTPNLVRKGRREGGQGVASVGLSCLVINRIKLTHQMLE